MISDKSLIHIAFALAIIGIIGLFIVTQFIGPAEMKIGKITASEAGQIAKIRGVVDSYYTKDGNVFLDVNDSSTIAVIMFQSVAKNNPAVYSIQKGDNVTIEGKIQLYKNELEIVANSVKRI